MLLRRWLEETPVFEQMRRRAALSRELPLRRVLRGYRRAIVASVISTWMLTAAIVVVILMTPSLLQSSFRLAPHDALLANLAPLVMVRAFPPAVRFTGVSLSYNISYALFGGVTPLLVSWLAHVNRLNPAHYVAAVGVLGLLATLVVPTAQPPVGNAEVAERA